MGQLDNRPESSGGTHSQETEAALSKVTQELRNLQENLIVQLTGDVEWLQSEKERLMQEIQVLRAEHSQLNAQQQQIVSQQQQRWAKQLAQTIASHLQTSLSRQITEQQGAGNFEGLPSTALNDSSEAVYRSITSLDATLSTTFKALQRDLTSYQSSLSQQLSRMNSLEQQGEALLAALVERLSEQLQAVPLMEGGIDRRALTSEANASDGRSAWTSSSTLSSTPLDDPMPWNVTVPEEARASAASSSSGKTVPIVPAPEPIVPPSAKVSAPSSSGKLQIGLLCVLLSSLMLSFHNVVVKILFRAQMVFNTFDLGGVISPGMGNSMLILWMRMVIVLPLMTMLAQLLYPPMWSDLRKLAFARDRSTLFSVIVSGLLLFLSQVLIYTALGQIPAGTAIAIFFIYPVVTTLLSWKVLGQRPTLLQLGVMVPICVGGILTLPAGNAAATGNPVLGIVSAVFAGVTFAGYVIATGICARNLNPVPVTLMQFVTIFVLTSVTLLLPFPETILKVTLNPDNWPGFLIGCLVLGAATLLGYLLNNFGIRAIGPAPAAIVSATGPALTALLALIMIQEQLGALQWFGVILVTAAVLALSVEKMLAGAKKTA